MKRLLLITITAAFLTGCGQSDKTAERITALEQRVSKLEAQRQEQAAADADRKAKLQYCITHDANEVFDQHLRLNASTHRGATYTVPAQVAEQALRLKQDKIEQCKLLYGQ